MAQRFMQVAVGLLFSLMPGALCAQFAGSNIPMVASGQMPTASDDEAFGYWLLLQVELFRGADFSAIRLRVDLCPGF